MKSRGICFALAALLAGHSLSLSAQEPDAMLQAVNPPGATIPNVSQAMRIDGGKLLLLSGHVPLRADGSVVEGSLEEQMEPEYRSKLPPDGEQSLTTAR